MSKLTQTIIGVSTLVPAAYIVAVLAFIGSVIFFGFDPDAMVGWLFVGNVSVAALIVAHSVLLIIHAARNNVLSDGGRCIWIVALFKLAPLAAPVYWFRYVRRQNALA